MLSRLSISNTEFPHPTNQHYPNLEYFVIDGSSNDETVELLRSQSAVVTHWVSRSDSGQAEALNEGFALASGR